MPRFTFRSYYSNQLPAQGANVRPCVAAALPQTIILDGRAGMVLSTVCGRQLKRVQRRILSDTLDEHINHRASDPHGAGPLSQDDIFGAILGVAHFCMMLPNRWLFVRIPEGQLKRPDLYALSPTDGPWFIELKAVAPLSSELDRGERLDTCKRIYRQRTSALQQLKGQLVTPGRNVPRILVNSFARGRSAMGVGGKALAITVVPDANLVTRVDLPIIRTRGCPGHLRCADSCLHGAGAGNTAAIVGLLWAERTMHRPAKLGRWRQILTGIHAANLAVWAGSPTAVNWALQSLVTNIVEDLDEENLVHHFEILGGCLSHARPVSDFATRRRYVREVAGTPVVQKALAASRQQTAEVEDRAATVIRLADDFFRHVPPIPLLEPILVEYWLENEGRRREGQVPPDEELWRLIGERPTYRALAIAIEQRLVRIEEAIAAVAGIDLEAEFRPRLRELQAALVTMNREITRVRNEHIDIASLVEWLVREADEGLYDEVPLVNVTQLNIDAPEDVEVSVETPGGQFCGRIKAGEELRLAPSLVVIERWLDNPENGTLGDVGMRLLHSLIGEHIPGARDELWHPIEIRLPEREEHVALGFGNDKAWTALDGRICLRLDNQP